MDIFKKGPLPSHLLDTERLFEYKLQLEDYARICVVLYSEAKSCHSPYRCMRGVDFRPKDCQRRIVSSAESMLLVQVRALFKVTHHSPYVDGDANGNDSLKINLLRKTNLPASKRHIF